MPAPKLTDLALETRTIDEQGGACPYQVRGTILGQEFYFRFRNDYAALRIGDGDPVAISELTGDSYAGSLTDEEFEAAFRKLLRIYLASLKL